MRDMRSWYLLLMLVVMSTGAMAQKYSENFDKSQLGTPRPWRLEGREDSPSAILSTNQSLSGSKSFRAYLPRQVYSNARTELRFEGENGVPKHQTIRDTWGASFAIYIPSNFKPDYDSREMIMQYHGMPDAEDTYKSPAFAIYVDGTKFTTRLRYYTGSPSHPSNQVDKSFDIGSLTPGQWHHFVVDIHWDYRQNGNGFAKIYMRKGSKPTASDQKVNYRGPIGANDDRGPYFKLGIYKWDWKKSAKVNEAKKAGIDHRMYYFDNVNIQKGAIIGGNSSSNSSPTVSISGTSSLTLPNNSTTLTANASDSDGSVASYSWTKTSGPSVSMSGKSSSKLSLSNMVAGTYKFQVKVTDNDGASTTSAKTVNVYSGTSSGGGSTTGGVSAGKDFAIDVAERNFDLIATWDSSIKMKTVKWTKISGPTCKIEDKGSKIHIHWIHVGKLVFEVKLTDTNNKVYTDRINVTVTDGPPQEDSGSSGAGTLTVDAGKDMVVPWADRNFDLIATWNSNLNVTSVKWTKLSGPNCKIEDKGNRLHVHWISAGNYEFEVEIKDNKGNFGTDRVKVKVTETSSSMASISDEFPGVQVRNFVTKEDTVSLMETEETKLKVFLRNTNGTQLSIGQFSGELNLESLQTGLYQYDVVEEGGDVVQQGSILVY